VIVERFSAFTMGEHEDDLDQLLKQAVSQHPIAMQGCGKGCDNMSAVVVVLKSFSPFTRNEHEVDLNQLPPMPALDDISPEFHGMPD